MLRVGCSGWVLMVGASRIWKKIKTKYTQGGRRNKNDVDLRSSFPIFHSKLRASCSRPPRVPPPFAPTCPSRSSITITRSPPSLSSKPPPSSRLRVFVFVCSVMCFYLSSCSGSLRLACCDYSSSTCSPITTKRLLVEEVVRPVAPTLWRVVVRLAYLLRHHRPPHRHAA